MNELKMCWSHSMVKESCLSPSWPSWPCFPPQSSSKVDQYPCFPPQSSWRSRRSRRLGRWTTASGFTRWLFLLFLGAMWKTKGWLQSFITSMTRIQSSTLEIMNDEIGSDGNTFPCHLFQRGSTDKILMAASNILMVSKRLKLCLKSISVLYWSAFINFWQQPSCEGCWCRYVGPDRVRDGLPQGPPVIGFTYTYMTPPLVRISSFDSTFNLMSRHLSRFIQ